MTQPKRAGTLTVQSVARAVSWSVAGDGTSKLAVVVVNVMVARALAPERFATYVGLLAAAYLGAAAWDAGVSTLVSVERARSHASLRSLANRVVQTRLRSLPAWFVAFVLGTLAVALATGPSIVEIAPFVVVSLTISLEQPAFAALRADLRFRQASVALSIGRWVAVAVMGVAVAQGAGRVDLTAVGLAQAIGEAALLLAAGLSLWWRHDPGVAGWDDTRIRLRAALPYAANSLISIAYNRLDVVVVAVLVPTAQLAAYVPASRIQDAAYVIPTAIAVVALPYLSRDAERVDADAAARRTLKRLWIVGSLVAVPAAVVATLLMPEVIGLLLGPDYATAVLPSRILIWSMPLSVIGAPLLAFLISRGRGAQTTTAFAVALVVSLSLHALLDPRFGAAGAAVASLTRDAANMVVAGLLVWRQMRSGGGQGFTEVPPTGNARAAMTELDSP